MIDHRALTLSHFETLTPAQALDLLPSLPAFARQLLAEFADKRERELSEAWGCDCCASEEALAWGWVWEVATD